MNLNRRHFLSLLGATAAGLALENYAFAQTPLDPQLISQADPQPIGTAVLPPLPYALDALQPYIDAETMEFHHGKHHKAYVRNLNAALDKYPQLKTKSIENLLRNLDRIPSDIRTTVRNNGGGHVNHSMFWKIMGPNAGGEPTGAIAEAINNSFGDFLTFKENFNKAGGGRFGSGWVMVILDGDDDDDNRKLKIITTPNQDSPLMEGKYPIMGNDVWEHAYYLSYRNSRGKYLEAWWNVVNWEEINKRYAQAIAVNNDDD
ncbi:superoxide dismutase [Mastigocoleus sp. MO_188.B34]|uniref:superoxide dismutase n=1 Tax=Mastigocoleus sp. MO_188.B34 TaxID=3036635 RepID=UPI002606447E|nr:superoxide dismutase [Mastigocoleus sp. MO_188.B34]MDJ0697620.1 superoxide dismutase [Mastigocoleus sp. MO_188.B34]